MSDRSSAAAAINAACGARGPERASDEGFIRSLPCVWRAPPLRGALRASLCGRESQIKRTLVERDTDARNSEPLGGQSWRSGGQSRRLLRRREDPCRRLPPELLQAVVLARCGREDMHDDIEIIHQDPGGARRAFHAPRQQRVLVLAALVDAVVDRLRLALCGT